MAFLNPITRNHPLLDLMGEPHRSFTPWIKNGVFVDAEVTKRALTTWQQLRRDFIQWRQHFPQEAWPLPTEKRFLTRALVEKNVEEHKPVALELGCGAGWFSVLQAHQHPEWLCIGVDRSSVRLGRAQRLAQGLGLSERALFFRSDNLPFLSFCIPDQSIALVSVLYANPHPKNTQSMRRFHYSMEMVRALDILKPGGTLLMTADHASFIREAAEMLATSEIPFETEMAELHAEDFSTFLPRTAFEWKYIQQRKILYQLISRKPSSQTLSTPLPEASPPSYIPHPLPA